MRAAAFFFDIEQVSFKVHIRNTDIADRRPALSGFDQELIAIVQPNSVYSVDSVKNEPMPYGFFFNQSGRFNNQRMGWNQPFVSAFRICAAP